MKTKVILTVLAFFLILSSCNLNNRSNNRCEHSYTERLTEFSNTTFGIFIPMSTRSTDGAPPQEEFNEEAFFSLIEEVATISEEFGFPAMMENSGYYRDFLSGSLSVEDYRNMDIYDILALLESNMTPEGYRIISDIIVYEVKTDNVAIIDNTLLFPFEQVMLISVNNCIKTGSLTRSTPDPVISECLTGYNSDMKTCDKVLAAGSALTIGSLLAGLPVLSAAFAVATSIDVSHCNNRALSTYIKCKEEEAKSILSDDDPDPGTEPNPGTDTGEGNDKTTDKVPDTDPGEPVIDEPVEGEEQGQP